MGINTMDLTLRVSEEWFKKIKSGEKTEEYRLDEEYWQKSLTEHSFVLEQAFSWPTSPSRAS